jgi:hypothetical protein
MTRATMSQEPLELYLLSKANDFVSLDISAVHVTRLRDTDTGCNWVVGAIEPALDIDDMRKFNDLVVVPAREAINLAD